MDVLVIGAGGREHAICLALSKSKKVNKIYCAPGNGGISYIAECVDIDISNNEAVVEFLKSKPNIELTVVAPDDPLVAGLVDSIEGIGRRAFGPNKKAAIIEGSKIFSKFLMEKYDIPTAKYYKCFDIETAYKIVDKNEKYPVVVKADGLALGKGVVIANTKEEAKQACKEMLVDKKFKSAGDNIIIEEFLVGTEMSVLVFTDGKTYKIMPSAQDHKRALDNDEGLNTGGMGAFSPSLKYNKKLEQRLEKEVIKPTLEAMQKEGRTFKGVLYFGLMLTESGIKVLEYNARFGDPETQVILPQLKTDIVDIFNAVIDERLAEIDIEWKKNKSTLCVVCASGGYPLSYEKHKEIKIKEKLDKDILIYYAGVTREGNKLYTSGGRVLCVVAEEANMKKARSKVYKNIKKIHFDKMHYRKDIGIKND